MTSSQRRTLPAIVTAAIGAGSTLALAAEPTVQDMQKQIEALQAQINQLKATQEQQVSAAAVDATVEQVLADAHKRSQLMQLEGFTAGYSKGKFLIQSADGAFTLNPNFQLQVRHVVNAQDDSDDDWNVEHGFEIRRMRFGVGGKLWKNVEYTVVWGSNRNGGGLSLEDAVVGYNFSGTPWTVFGGQFKDPVHHEELVSSKHQIAAERSLLNEILGGGQTDRIQGVGVRYEDGPLMGTVVFHDGANSDNTNFLDGGNGAAPVDDAGADFGISARVEYLAFGNKKAYEDFTAMGNEEDLLVLGAGIDWTQDGSADVYFHTVDAQWETAGGLAIYGAYVATFTDFGDDDTYDWGAVGQVAYMLNDKWEVFGRYAYIDLDNSDEELHEITGGVNYYVHGHSAKFTIDLTYLPNGAGGADTGLGYVDSGDDDQFVLRSQFQLLI